MKTIKNISVECSFRVAFSNVEVPDDVYEQLENNQEFTCDDSKNAERWNGFRTIYSRRMHTIGNMTLKFES